CCLTTLTCGTDFHAEAAPAASNESSVRTITNPTTRVQPILFIPNNLTADAAYLPAINASLATLSAWYASQLGGRTFNYVPAQAVIGKHELSYYCPKTTNTSQCIQVPGELGADPGDIFTVL